MFLLPNVVISTGIIFSYKGKGYNLDIKHKKLDEKKQDKVRIWQGYRSLNEAFFN